jgi:hypothetical protein
LRLLERAPPTDPNAIKFDARAYTTLLSRLPSYPKFRAEYIRIVIRHQIDSGIEPDAHLLRAILSAYQNIEDLSSADSIAEALIRIPGSERDIFTATALLRFYSISGQEKRGDAVIESVLGANLRLDRRFYGTHLEFLARFGRFDEIFTTVDDMLNSGLTPEPKFYVRILRELRSRPIDHKDSDHTLARIVALMKRTKTPQNVFITTSLMQYVRKFVALENFFFGFRNFCLDQARPLSLLFYVKVLVR